VTFSATAVTVMVEVRDSEAGGFIPKHVTVPPGKSVAWTYSSGQGRLHNVTFEDDPTQPVSSRVLWLPGMYHVRSFGATSDLIRYRCTYHSTGFTDGEVGTVTVEVPPPPPSGMIAFVHSDTLPSEGGIYTINADGTGARRLTDSQNYGGEPAWSPDGAKLAFTRITRDPEWTLLEYLDPDIYVINADGSGLTRLTTDAHSGNPAWSPDGRRIAFTRGSEIYVMNADGSGATRLTNNPGQDNAPAWSPDGTKIAFAS
jgi:plastocyanin